ncbi:ThiF family adenylyltransferase [Streptomyces sp. NPDC006289]|uniref:ThiF family adenylyltransferase n=1 Tax=Streptomyces sp. NPDC006289 TaxID=3156744 RepID=UPI0033BE89FD
MTHSSSVVGSSSPRSEEPFRPVLFDLSSPAERTALHDLRASGRVRDVHDRIDSQLGELVSCLSPGSHLVGAELAAAISHATDGVPSEAYGTWVWYPWSGSLVHVLPRDEYRLVRTDRNRGKITRSQQRSLLTRSIGVIGLSVGAAAAMACAAEGVGGTFLLADLDQLSLSNLNRLRAGVDQLGVDKTVLCARAMADLDPYLEVEIYRDGLDETSLAAFVDRCPDLLIEECDTPWAKVAVREMARAQRVPVLMEANDRGLLDIERFDLEPHRPLFHGRIGATTARDVRQLDRAGLTAFMLQAIGAERLSPEMAEALPEIGRTLSSWPQLASGVLLGGALVTDSARRILLGEHVMSGSYSVDLNALIPSQDIGRARAEPVVAGLSDVPVSGGSVTVEVAR